MNSKKAQVLDQLEVVVHLAARLGEINEAMRSMGEQFPDDILDIVGARTAYVMEVIGDILSNQDAIDEQDEWTDPIFEKAQELWPVIGPETCAHELLSMVRRYASECANCNGSGQVFIGYSGLESDGNAPITEKCEDCADIRQLIGKAGG